MTDLTQFSPQALNEAYDLPEAVYSTEAQLEQEQTQTATPLTIKARLNALFNTAASTVQASQHNQSSQAEQNATNSRSSQVDCNDAAAASGKTMQHWAQALLQQIRLPVILLELAAVNRHILAEGQSGLTPSQLARLVKQLEQLEAKQAEQVKVAATFLPENPISAPYLDVIQALTLLQPARAANIVPRLINRLRNRVYHQIARQRRRMARGKSKTPRA
ncbi:MAG: hypothetical protein VKJ06_03370 [Vampirovibrionales bacterium]|nr:hypothetical protein [Vampirovibrionales bacterium]